MKITLLSPQSEMYRKRGIFSKLLRYAPLTLTTLAALVPEELNAEIRLIDEGVEDLNIDAIDADIVGITCITPNAPRVYDLSRQLRERGITVVIGGVHPTLVPDEAQAHADAIVVGYAEQSWPQLLRDFAAHKLQPRYNEGPGYRFANVPEPRRDLLKKEGYITLNTVQAVRGCPYKCNFCVVPVAWPGYLQRPIREVISEIERLEGSSFLFLDLSPTENQAYIKQMYRELAPLKKRWGGLSTLRIAQDREMLKLAAQSGCGGLLIGFESISQSTIKQMKKGFNKPDQYIEAAKVLHGHGIAINGCFVFGLDGDDKGIFERTVEFVNKAAIDLPRFSIATPFPGTPLYHQLNREGRILIKDWTYYGGQNVVFQPQNMSVEELQKGVQWAWRQVYSLPSIVRRVVGSGVSHSSLVFRTSLLANFGYTKYARMLPDYVPVPCEFDEPLWEQVIRDAERGMLQRRYTQNKVQPYTYGMPRRDIFKGKPYFKLSCLETGRGCPLHCNFCSIAAVTASRYNGRPIEQIVAEISMLQNKNIFFVDDNFVGNLKHARELCREIAPLKIRWVGQGTLNMARDEKLLETMAESGCAGVLIGLESLRHDTLQLMDKQLNVTMGDYKKLIDRLHQYGIGLYGTFIFGYDSESAADTLRTAEAAIDFGLFIAAFNHLLPFPGTPLYEQFRKEGKLTDEQWWLSPTFRFGDVPFNPKNMTAQELRELCLQARRRFYSFSGIARRSTNIKGNATTLKKAALFWGINGLLRKEIRQKDGLPLGNNPTRPLPLYQNEFLKNK